MERRKLMSKKHIIFSRQDTSGCSIIRLEYVKEYINNQSLEFEVRWARDKDTLGDDEIAWGDLFVIQRKVILPWLKIVKRLHKLGKKVIYEIDDSIVDRGMPKGNPGALLYNRSEVQVVAKKIIEECDGVTTTTTQLAGMFGKYNGNVKVLRNSLPMTFVEECKIIKPSFVNPNPFILAWPTSSFHNQDIPIILDPLKHITQKFSHVKFLAMGEMDKQFVEVIPESQRFFIPWKMVPEFYHAYRRLPIHAQIAPLRLPSVFNEGKSEIKILDGAQRHTATVCSPAPNYLLYKNESFVVNSNSKDEWISVLEDLVEHPMQARKIGERAYKRLCRSNNMDKNWRLWETFYKEVLENEG